MSRRVSHILLSILPVLHIVKHNAYNYLYTDLKINCIAIIVYYVFYLIMHSYGNYILLIFILSSYEAYKSHYILGRLVIVILYK